MPALLSRTRVGRGGIVQVPVNEIDPNPNQPRRSVFGIVDARGEIKATTAIKTGGYEKVEDYVKADACTDNTAQLAREAGAIVYERNDLARKGRRIGYSCPNS